MQLIRNASRNPAADQIDFRKMIMFNYLIGNSDAHGKNFALLYSEKTPVLAPLYDVVSTTIYPKYTSNMAMGLLNQHRPHKIGLKHWLSIVPRTKPAQKQLFQQLDTMAKKCF